MEIIDDGLITPEVGIWSEKKYKLVEYNASMFATSMKNKWDCRVFLDLDSDGWRSEWQKAKVEGISFGMFIFREFSKQMEKIGYQHFEPKDSVLVRNFQKNAPLYRLALYSKHPRGLDFFKKAKIYHDPQLNLFDTI